MIFHSEKLMLNVVNKSLDEIVLDFERVCDDIENDEKFAKLYDATKDFINSSFWRIHTGYESILNPLKITFYKKINKDQRKYLSDIIKCILEEKNKKHQPLESGTQIVFSAGEKKFVSPFIERQGSKMVVNFFNREAFTVPYNFFVKVVEEYEDHVCMNCGRTCLTGRMCNEDFSCNHDTQYVIDEILKVENNLVTIKWKCDGSTSEVDLQQIWEDNPILLGEFLAKNGDPQNGFYFDPDYHEEFRDRRLRPENQYKRENLWSAAERPVMNTHTRYDDYLLAPDGRWLPKSRFSDRRLKWTNRGRRYNLHPH